MNGRLGYWKNSDIIKSMTYSATILFAITHRWLHKPLNLNSKFYLDYQTSKLAVYQ